MEFDFDRFFRYGDQAALYGLALVFLLAGLSKFVMPELWSGFIPRWLYQSLPLMESHLSYGAAVFEVAAGALLALRWKPRLVASAMAVWLAGITVTVASMQLWTIALRDFGLTALAYKVAADHSDL